MDMVLDVIAWCGLGLSSIMMLCGSCNVIISTLLWLLYHSLVNVGQRWYVLYIPCVCVCVRACVRYRLVNTFRVLVKV